ncbi:MAG: hypothetical protein IPJ88_17675 [Myxococcales bacterium]|nr:MAG: hypothetical protein IPJ88_17675 [Myxococcales bacterium]
MKNDLAYVGLTLVLFAVIAFAGSTAFACPAPDPAYSIPVTNPAAALPSTPPNLVTNPWFRNGNDADLSGWTDETNPKRWSLSQKDSNPTADQVTSGDCPGSNYCGTAARMAMGSGQGGGGTGVGGVDAVLSQTITANASDTYLSFFSYYVTGTQNEVARIRVFGRSASNQSWVHLWTPLDLTSSCNSNMAWTDTGCLTTELDQGYGEYRLEFTVRYPANNNQGAKFTGVYFATSSEANNSASCQPGGIPGDGSSPGNLADDAGVLADGGAGGSDVDGGVPVETDNSSGGCDCHLAGPSSTDSAFSFLFGALAVLGLARLRRRRG